MRHCIRCVLPDTKPDLRLDADGVCSACRAFERRTEVDWDQRLRELKDVLGHARKWTRSGWDCVIPVSGGKDSHYQTLKILDLGYRPVCVTATTDHLTDLGRRNIENLKSLGVDYVEITADPKVRARIAAHALRTVGDISWAEHRTIFTLPIRFALWTGTPLIVWGENPQNEYGGPEQDQNSIKLGPAWLDEFGGLLGMRLDDVQRALELADNEMVPYRALGFEDYREGVEGIFLGAYVPWDGWRNALVAQAHGFETYSHVVEGSMVAYENLDNAQTGIHDYFKYLKYGFGRASDIASMHVRRGRLSRAEACALVERLDGRYPACYLGVELEEILDRIGMNGDEFNIICDRFTNGTLFLPGRRYDGSPELRVKP